jgi:hypothetical protein
MSIVNGTVAPLQDTTPTIMTPERVKKFSKLLRIENALVKSCITMEKERSLFLSQPPLHGGPGNPSPASPIR